MLISPSPTEHVSLAIQLLILALLGGERCMWHVDMQHPASRLYYTKRVRERVRTEHADKVEPTYTHTHTDMYLGEICFCAKCKCSTFMKKIQLKQKGQNKTSIPGCCPAYPLYKMLFE